MRQPFVVLSLVGILGLLGGCSQGPSAAELESQEKQACYEGGGEWNGSLHNCQQPQQGSDGVCQDTGGWYTDIDC